MTFRPEQYEAARLMRDSANEDLLDVLPGLRPEAVKLTVSRDDLTVVASIQGNLDPYSHDEVVYCLDALDVRLPGVEVSL